MNIIVVNGGNKFGQFLCKHLHEKNKVVNISKKLDVGERFGDWLYFDPNEPEDILKCVRHLTTVDNRLNFDAIVYNLVFDEESEDVTGATQWFFTNRLMSKRVSSPLMLASLMIKFECVKSGIPFIFTVPHSGYDPFPLVGIANDCIRDSFRSFGGIVPEFRYNCLEMGHRSVELKSKMIVEWVEDFVEDKSLKNKRAVI